MDMGASGFEAREALCITFMVETGRGVRLGRLRRSFTLALAVRRAEKPDAYFFAGGAILESLAASGLAASGLASVLAASSGLSRRSTLAASRSFAT